MPGIGAVTMPATRVEMTPEGIVCSACGPLEHSEPVNGYDAFNHMLDAHRAELIQIHGQKAVERAEVKA